MSGVSTVHDSGLAAVHVLAYPSGARHALIICDFEYEYVDVLVFPAGYFKVS